MKILAIYLPAFHQSYINDAAWGNGFTEWNNVKAGQPLFKNHYQPVVPLNKNYYDLSSKNDIENQVEIAKKYGVDGFIFYHYWFGDNKQALEKPASIYRNQLKEKVEYCFCWANESWLTTWHGKDSEIIVEQKYGDESEWIKHIKYLIDFFKDDKYIKIGNRPMLYIYKPNFIEEYDKMIEFWNKYLNENGLGNIYIVEYISSKNKKLYSQKSDAVVEFEPLYSTYFDISKINKAKRYICKKMKIVDFQDYDNLWNKIIKRKRKYNGKPIFKGCFVGWDNSPRKGKNSMIVKGATPEKFGYNLRRLINNKRPDATNDYVVINAWNEWSEGAMLEPTEKYGYRYLEEIKKIKDGDV